MDALRIIALVACLVIALLASPQLLWLSSQAHGGGPRLALGMLQPADSVLSWLRDVVLDLGAWLVLLPIAWFAGRLGPDGWMLALGVYVLLVPAALAAGAGRPLSPRG